MTDAIGRGDYELDAKLDALKRSLAEAERAIKSSGQTAEQAFARQGTAAANKMGKSQGLLVKQSAELKKGMLAGVGIGGGVVAFQALERAVSAVADGTIGAAAALDDSMTKSLAIMGDVSEAMRSDMTDAARTVAKETTFSAKQAADAYFYLASAGLDATASMAAMPKVAAFAQAGNFDLARATDLLTDAQSALGLSIRDDVVANMQNMVRVSDVLVKANTLSNATVEQFSESLTNRGAAALRLVGKELEEGAALLAAWADQGVKGAEAGTRLDIVLRDLQTAAIKNEDAFRSYGVTVFDAAGEMRPLADIISDMEQAFAGLSDRQVRTGLTTLGFQSRTVSATASLLGTSDAIREYERQLRSAGGTTQDVADKQLQSFSSQVALLEGELADMGITIGQALIPDLVVLARTIREEVIPFFEDLAAQVQRFSPDFDFGYQFEKEWQRITGSLAQTEELDALHDKWLALAHESLATGRLELGQLAVYLEEATRKELLLMTTTDRFAKVAEGLRSRVRGGAAAVADLGDGADDAEEQMDELTKAVLRLATDGFGNLRKEARAWDRQWSKMLEGPDKVDKGIKVLRRELRQVQRQQREATKAGREDLLAMAVARETELRSQLTDAKAARTLLRQRQAALKEERATVQLLAQQYGVSTASIRRKLQRNGGDIVAVRKKLEDAKEGADDLGKSDPDVDVDTPGLDSATDRLLRAASAANALAGTYRVRVVTSASGSTGQQGNAQGVLHSGSHYVPSDGTYYLQRGEGVLTKAANRRLRTQGELESAGMVSPGGQHAQPGQAQLSIVVDNSGAVIMGNPEEAQRFAQRVAPPIYQELARLGLTVSR